MIFITVRLNKNHLDIVEAEELSRKLVLKKTVSSEVSIETRDNEKVEEIASIILSLVDIKAKFTKLAFCIDTKFAFLNVIPIDANLSEQDLNEHLLWEVSQYFPGESAHGLVVRGYRFGAGNVQRTLMVAVKKELISFLRAIADKLNLRPQIIDIDHFAVENCLRERITPIRSRYFYKDFLLAGVKRGRIDVSIFRNYEFQRYFYYVPHDDSDIRYFVIKLINDNVSSGFDKFVFYGDMLDSSIVDLISDMLGNKFSLLNPFDSRLFLDVKVSPETAHIYAPNIGLALRMLWSG